LRSRQPRRADSPHPAPPRLSAQRERSAGGQSQGHARAAGRRQHPAATDRGPAPTAADRAGIHCASDRSDPAHAAREGTGDRPAARGAARSVAHTRRRARRAGGDMDGKPNAGAETLRSALARQRELVVELYRREAADLARRLSQSGARTGVSDAVRERVATYDAQFPKTLAAIPTRYHDMPYR